MSISDKMKYLSKEFMVAVAIFDLTVVKGLEATKISLHSLTPKYMNSGELTASLHFLESWGIIKRRITDKMVVHYLIREEDFMAIQRLHEMCWGRLKDGKSI